MSVCDHSPRCTLPHSFSFLRPESSPFCSPISINKSNFAHRETQRLLAVHGRAQSLVVRVCNTHRRGCPPTHPSPTALLPLVSFSLYSPLKIHIPIISSCSPQQWPSQVLCSFRFLNYKRAPFSLQSLPKCSCSALTVKHVVMFATATHGSASWRSLLKRITDQQVSPLCLSINLYSRRTGVPKNT